MGRKSMKSKSEPPSRFCKDISMTIWQTHTLADKTSTLPVSKPTQEPRSKKTSKKSNTLTKSGTLRTRPEISGPIVGQHEISTTPRHGVVGNGITREDITFDDESAESSTSDSEVVWGSLRRNTSTTFRPRGIAASASETYGASQASSSDEDTLRGTRGRSRTFSQHGEDPALRYQSLPFLPVPTRLRMATLNRNSRQRFSFHGSSSAPAIETEASSQDEKEHTFVRKKYAVLVLDKESSPLVQRYAPDDDYD